MNLPFHEGCKWQEGEGCVNDFCLLTRMMGAQGRDPDGAIVQVHSRLQCAMAPALTCRLAQGEVLMRV